MKFHVFNHFLVIYIWNVLTFDSFLVKAVNVFKLKSPVACKDFITLPAFINFVLFPGYNFGLSCDRFGLQFRVKLWQVWVQLRIFPGYNFRLSCDRFGLQFRVKLWQVWVQLWQVRVKLWQVRVKLCDRFGLSCDRFGLSCVTGSG